MKNSPLAKLLTSEIGPLAALLVIAGLFAIADQSYGAGKFATMRNFRVIANSASLIAVPAFGMTLIIIAGGIDLSAGTALTLCGTILATQLKYSEVSAEEPGFAMVMCFALLMTVAVGCLCGFVNGALISVTNVVPFIVTLGTMTIFLGIGQIVSNESTVYAPTANVPQWLNTLTYTGSSRPENYFRLGPLPLMPTSAWMALLMGLVVAALMRYSVFGRHVFAMGSSESTARLCGINVPLTMVIVYTIAGFFVAMGGLLYYADTANGNPTDGTGKELEIIAAVVLGGGSLSGGRGSILGTLIGALIITVIRTGCSHLSIPNTYTHIIIGCIIIVAVVVDQLRHGSPKWLFNMLGKA